MEPAFYMDVYSSYKNPEAYFAFFDSIWGSLVEQEGEIVWNTLTQKQADLVNFPAINPETVYYTSAGGSYHATEYCYTLVKSNNILSCSLDSASDSLKPCSKCVDTIELLKLHQAEEHLSLAKDEGLFE